MMINCKLIFMKKKHIYAGVTFEISVCNILAINANTQERIQEMCFSVFKLFFVSLKINLFLFSSF